MNPTFRTQLHRSSKHHRIKKGENFREATKRDWDVWELTEVWLGERRMYDGNSISKVQIQVATYVFELSAGKLSPLDSSTI
jgi:hypothetical protein